MLPSSGAAVFTASGPSGDRPDARSTTAFALCEVGAVGQDVRRQHAGRARLVAQFGDQLVARAVRAAARIALVGDDHLAHERLDARAISSARPWSSMSSCICLVLRSVHCAVDPPSTTSSAPVM